MSEICGQLDGIPLAIELAAARCRSMAPAKIATRLDDRIRLLRGGRGGVERHQTLHAAVEWSYSLLDLRSACCSSASQCSPMGGLLDAITAVSGLDEYDALDLLDRLVARSMVVAIDTPLGTRYRQLDTLRQYAEGRLVEHGRIDETRDRHLSSYEIIDWFDPTTIPADEWTEGVALFVSASRLVRLSGDQPTGFLLFRYAGRLWPVWLESPDATLFDGLGGDTIARIEHQAAQLDSDQAGAIALAALDRIITEPTGVSQ